MTPARIDSTGKPGIPPGGTALVLVIVVVVLVEMIMVEVDTVDAVRRVVDVDTVETDIIVEVVENMPPKGANLSTVDKGFPRLDP